MDTREEIAMDEWIENHMGMCGTCEYMVKGICKNDLAYEFEDNVENTDTCGEWVKKDFAKALSESRRRMYEKIKRANNEHKQQ